MGDEWPKDDWFTPADTHYLVAIGAITTRYARLENALRRLADFYLRSLPYDLRFQILQPMTNAERSAVLRTAVEVAELNETVREEVLFFLRAFSVCTENRSVAAHADGMPGETHVHLTKRTSGPPYRRNRYPLTIAELQGAADSTLDFVKYGGELHRFLSTQEVQDARKDENWSIGPRALPKRPAPPSKLVPHPPEAIHPDDPIPF